MSRVCVCVRSYWLSTVGLYLFYTVAVIFSVEYCQELKICVRGCSRSQKMVTLKSLVRFPIRIP